MGQLRLTRTTPARRVEPFKALVAAGVAGFAWWATARGLAVTPDSADYISSGVNLASGTGLTTYANEPLTTFPPGMSLIFGLGHIAHISPSWVARLVNVSSITATAFAAMKIVERYVVSLVTVLAVGFLVGLSYCSAVVDTAVWSEPLFDLLVLVALVAYVNFQDNPSSGSRLVILGLAVSAAFMVRYVGLVLIPVFALSLVWSSRRRPPWDVAAMLGRALAVMSFVPAVFIARNYLTDGTALGLRPNSEQPLGGTLSAFLHQAVTLITGGASSGQATNWRVVLVVLVCAVTVLIFAVLKVQRSPIEPRDTRFPGIVTPLGLYLLGYSGYLIIAQLSTAIDPFDMRLLAPLLAPLVLFVVIIFSRIRVSPHHVSRQLWEGAGSVLALCVLYFQIVGSVSYVGELTLGAAHSPATSQIMNAAVHLSDGRAFYTNIGFDIWVAHPRNGILSAPRRGSYRSRDVYPVAREFLNAVACRPRLLVWADYGRDWYYPPEKLASFVDIAVVRRYSDGVLYRLSPRSGPSSGKCAVSVSRPRRSRSELS